MPISGISSFNFENEELNDLLEQYTDRYGITFSVVMLGFMPDLQPIAIELLKQSLDPNSDRSVIVDADFEFPTLPDGVEI